MARIIVDGQSYGSEDDVPDFGSLVCAYSDNVEWFNPTTKKIEIHSRRTYKGLAVDVDKLPHYPHLATGSAFYAIDDDNVFREYEHTSDTWYGGN